jgi:HAD superfamily hydrolase (TIGR01484 family)
MLYGGDVTTMSDTNSVARKRIIIFDLDGTLTESKSDLDNEMASLICELLQLRYVAVTSGCSFQQLKNQFLTRLPKSTNLSNLFLFPTCSASGYYYDRRRGRFSLTYSNPRKMYGPFFENRGSQLTFSALGQKAPLRLKQKWDPNQKKRLRIRQLLKTQLPGFEITIGGTTSIDVTKNGVNKTLCVTNLEKRLSVKRENMLFVGDALFKGGNDHIMRSTGVRCLSVSGPKQTKKLVRRIIQNDQATSLPDTRQHSR